MSRTVQTAAASPKSGTNILPANVWIIGPREDLLLFLGTPLILLGVFAFAERTWTVSALGIFTTMLAMGHYLPGLMRTYGDPALFRRFRTRFILAPIVLIGTAVWMANHEVHAFLIVVVAWGAWHWLMQTYGLARIYDAKVRNFDTVSARLDYALCIAWFGVLYWLTDGTTGILLHYYRAGGALPPTALRAMAWIWLAATIAISWIYVFVLVRRWREGHPPSVLKLALLAVSFFFYLYAFRISSSKLVAFGLFEGYHDVQYLAIVWIFNRNRAERDPGAGSFTRFLFRRRGLMIVFYVELCLGFGSYDYFARSLNDGQIARAALGVITGLALVHFYFDGFIWRIRESQTRSALGVGGTEAKPHGWRIPSQLRHGLLWVALSVPIVALGVWELRGGRTDDAVACEKVLAVHSRSHKAHYLLGSMLFAEGKHEEALDHARHCRTIRPGYDLYEMLYADALMARDLSLGPHELDDVIRCYEKAAKTRSNVAQLHVNWGKALRLRGDTQAAFQRYRAAYQLDPKQTAALFEMATLAHQQQDYATAVQLLGRLIEVVPEHVAAYSRLGTAWLAQGQTQQALRYYNTALELNPESVRALTGSALILANAHNTSLRDSDEAIRRANRALQVSRDADTLSAAAQVFAAVGDFQHASHLAGEAERRYREAKQANKANTLRGMLARYQQGHP